MMQRSLQHDAARGLHVAVIMDGNGRWAERRGLPRTAGHRAGADAVRRTVEAAPACGVSTLTLYAFSSDNWRRPAREVKTLMRLLGRYLSAEAGRLAERGVRLKVVGRRDRLAPTLRAAIEEAEARTAHGRRLRLRIAVDYSARDAILRASLRHGAQGRGPNEDSEVAEGGHVPKLTEARQVVGARQVAAVSKVAAVSAVAALTEVGAVYKADGVPEVAGMAKAAGGAQGADAAEGVELRRAGFARLLGEATNDTEPSADVDLLVRTGGEQRLSDFLLWECAYAELYFTPRMWPDFGGEDLAAAVAEFHRRERRFGRVPLAASG